MIRIQSTSPPFDSASIARRAAEAIALADGMGLLGDLRIEHLDLASFREVVSHIAEAGIGREVEAALSASEVAGEEVDQALDRLLEALADSPVPSRETPALIALFGPDSLARLVGVSPVSARRYAAGERPVPDTIANRLHLVAIVVGDLAGSYNEYGIRRWFDRRRSVLGDRSPAELLDGDWSPDDPGPRRVLELAASLSGSPAT